MSWQDRLTLQPGETVRLSRELARSIRSDPEAHKARGKVLAVEDWEHGKIARVAWDRPNVPEEINVLQLIAVKERHR